MNHILHLGQHFIYNVLEFLFLLRKCHLKYNFCEKYKFFSLTDPVTHAQWPVNFHSEREMEKVDSAHVHNCPVQLEKMLNKHVSYKNKQKGG